MCYSVIKSYQEIAGLYPIAITNQQFTNDAASRVLNLFDV